MSEGIPNQIETNKVDEQSEKEARLGRIITLAREVIANAESLPFPGIKPESYNTMKRDEAEYPGYTTPIDELLARFETEDIKITLGKNPQAGNVFFLPSGSNDIENDGILLKHLQSSGDMDINLQDLLDVLHT